MAERVTVNFVLDHPEKELKGVKLAASMNVAELRELVKGQLGLKPQAMAQYDIVAVNPDQDAILLDDHFVPRKKEGKEKEGRKGRKGRKR